MSDLIATDEQNPYAGTIVSLYTIDARAIGGDLYRFVTGPYNAAQVAYQGHTYTPLPIAVAGIKYGGEGAVARPTLTMSGLDRGLVAALVATDDWRGALFTRLRTLTRYLDGEDGADATRHWPADIYRIESKTSASKSEIKWQLASPLDFDKKKLPGRQIWRDICPWEYPIYDNGTWDYSNAQCPYIHDSGFYDEQDNPVPNAAQDKPSRRLGCCKARFGTKALPFGGFVGVARLRK